MICGISLQSAAKDEPGSSNRLPCIEGGENEAGFLRKRRFVSRVRPFASADGRELSILRVIIQ
jgi:hypothetical protein